MDVVGQIQRGGYFGELALLNDAPRNATCRATVPAELLSLSYSDFDGLVRQRFALREKVDEAVRRVELLRNIPLFADLDAAQLHQLASALHPQSFGPGQPLMCQGEVGETLYIIESGCAEVTIHDTNRHRAASRGAEADAAGAG